MGGKSALLSLALVLMLQASIGAFAEELTFIVNAKNPVETLTVADLRDFYLKKKRTWPDGTSVRFIDRAAGMPVRKLFLDKVLKQTAEEVELYWIGQKLYSGESSPLQERNDRMTIQFVSAFKGAVGYVKSDASLSGANVKVIAVENL
jgi:ABC-type phosphate transport system substrate-binding protein